MSPSKQHDIIHFLNMRYGFLPCVYLRVPLFKSTSKIFVLRLTIDNKFAKLSSWYGRILYMTSKVG